MNITTDRKKNENKTSLPLQFLSSDPSIQSPILSQNQLDSMHLPL